MPLSSERLAAPEATVERKPFGRWLVGQVSTPGLIGQLAAAAAADRSFPRDGTPRQVKARLLQNGADGDMFEALDDAELSWLTL